MQANNPERTRKLVLLVDDSPTQAQRAAQALQAAGFRVRVAANGREALDQARRWRPDVIISDILMPVMDGFALCRELRRDPLLAQVPIILHTLTYVEPRDAEFALALGATRFVVKPADAAALVDEVRQVLAAGHHSAQPEIAADETAFFQGYSERLAAKLEDKVAELEAANRELERRHQETVAARDRLMLLLEISRVAASSLDLPLLLDRLAERSAAAVRASVCRVALLDETGARLTIAAAWPRDPFVWEPAVGAAFALDEAPCHRAALQADAARVFPVAGVGAEMTAAERAAARLQTMRAVLLAPLALGGRPLGLLCLGETRAGQSSPFSDDQLELARGIAAQAVLAIENARRHQEQVQAEREARLLADIGALFADAADRAEALRRVAASTAAALADACVLQVREPDGRLITVVQHRDPAAAAPLERLLAADGVADAIAALLQTTEPLLLPDLARADLPPQARERLAAFGLRSLHVAPLTTTRDRLGSLLLLGGPARPLGPTQAATADRLALRIARLVAGQLLRDALLEARLVAAERNTLRATLEASQDAVVILDAALEARVGNHRFAEWFGLALDELNRLPEAEREQRLFARLERPDEARDWVRLMLADPAGVARRRMRLTSGPVREVDCFSAPVRDADGTAFGRVFAFHDLSREAELARAKDEIVSVVSHELRTPLASLVGFAELLSMRDYPEQERRQYLAIMLQEGRRLTALINDFLDLQRIESGRHKIALKPVALHKELEQARTAAGDDPERPILLSAPEDLPYALADPGALQQVLANLLANARKYSPRGGAIHLSAEVLHEQITVSVADSGLGIPPEALPRLFEKFYRVDHSDRRAIRGTGLGLAICKQIVEAHGGRIWAESTGIGHGARLSFTLPLAHIAATRGDVLIVEDDIAFARLLEIELAGQGLSAVRAGSAEEALARLAAAPPRGVLLDLILPGVQGEEFLRRMRAAGASDIPVAVVTVKNLATAERQALEDLRVVGIFAKGPGVASAAVGALARTLAERVGPRPEERD